MPAAYVNPYVKRGKTNAADAEAIAEAVTRPTMRFVAVKTVEQQAVLMLYKTRDLLIRQRTMLINALRRHLGEYGAVAAKAPGGVSSLITMLHEVQGSLPPLARSALHAIANQLRALGAEVQRLETELLAWHPADATSRRLATIPGIDAARFGQPLQPGGDVDALAVEVVPFDHDVAEVDPDAELEALVGRQASIASPQLLLRLNRAQDGLDHARELGDQPVAQVLTTRPRCRSISPARASRCRFRVFSVPTSSRSMSRL
jgi:hypothetical protein